MAEAAYENPLIPNARLKQIARSMAQVRLLGEALPARSRGGWRTGLEACLVSPSIDLGPQDIVSDTLSGGVIDYLRGTPLPSVFNPATKSSRKLTADCGSAGSLPSFPTTPDRLWATLGAAAALKATAAAAKLSTPEVEGTMPPQPGVAVIYLTPGEATGPVFKKSLTFASQNLLPAVFVVLPPARTKSSPAALHTGTLTALSLRCGVPAIAVDADDAVAIYRVAQESIGRARAGGGAALIECVPFILHGATGKQAIPQDALATIERYLLHRKVTTQGWMNNESRIFAHRLTAEKARS